MNNLDRVIWPIAWIIITPAVVGFLMIIAGQVLPLPDFYWGMGLTLFILAVTCSMPVWILSSARKASHTAGAVLATIALAFSILGTIAGTTLTAYMESGIESSGQVETTVEIPYKQ